ncbi:MAG: DUF3298 and DUF4163 domain-containing protein [Clostridia bacterium]|nr:DUF3298 and DUF4163 domain-containing protein [Clostridia bacterium]
MNPTQLPVQIIPKRLVRQNLNVVYPMVTAGTNPMAMHTMNRQIYSLVDRLIAEQGYYQSPQTISVTGYFEIKNNQRGVLSISIINYAYPERAAHGLTIIKSLNFDIRTGSNYSLEQLFIPGSDYQTRLETIIKEQIREREIPVITEFPGVSPRQDYYIADKALVIYYQLYELAPYAYGFPQFPISVYELQDIIREDSLLAPMLMNS